MSAPVDVLAVPGLFWRDHADRHPTDDGAAIAQPIGDSNGRMVKLRCDDPGIHWLRKDAAYYADADSMDECPRNLRESARRTLAALARCGVVK